MRQRKPHKRKELGQSDQQNRFLAPDCVQEDVSNETPEESAATSNYRHVGGFFITDVERVLVW